MQAQGWCPDPYGIHDDRWFSGGEPTSLVRDQGVESFDEPPRGQLPPGPPGREEPPQEGLPPHPPGPPGGQQPPARAGRRWNGWTVGLPGLLALAIAGFLSLLAAVASAMSCMDTCQNPAGPDPSALAVEQFEFIVFIAAGVLLAGGLVIPPWRRGIAAALWAAIALAIGFNVLH